jgi:hypothetical protein
MTPELSDDQRHALEAQGGATVYVVDSVTSASYVLLQAEVYERFRAMFEEEFDPREAYPYIDRVMAEDDANDPALASYQDSPPGKSQ